MKKKIFIFYLILQIMVMSVIGSMYQVPVYASTLSDNIREAQQARDAILDYFDNATHIPSHALNNFFKAVGTGVGFLVGGFALSEANFRSIFNGKNYGGITFDSEDDQQATDDIARFMVNNVNITNNGITFNNYSNQALKDLIQFYINQQGYYYVYSYDIRKTVTNWSNGVRYNGTKALINQYQGANYTLFQNRNYKQSVYTIPRSRDIRFVCTNLNGTQIRMYRASSWQEYTNPRSQYTGDITNGEWVVNEISLPENPSGNIYASLVYPTGGIGSNIDVTNNVKSWIMNDGFSEKLKVFTSVANMKEDATGISSYYETQYYYDFSNNNTSTYTVNDENYNPITYGDINTWITDNTTPEGPPTPDEIDRHIKEYSPTVDQPDIDNPTNPNNPSNPNGTTSGNTVGGTSSATATATATNGNVNVTVNNNPNINIGIPTLSDNTVSGNGVSNGVGDIFGFLSGIGEALGSLIKNLGNALSEIITALTGFIDDIVVRVPYLFTQIMNVVFAGLPEELKAVIVLGVTVMVLFGIIKMIRG